MTSSNHRNILIDINKQTSVYKQKGGAIVYQIIDRQTGAIMGTYKGRIRARHRADRLDNEYGAHRYYVRQVTV